MSYILAIVIITAASSADTLKANEDGDLVSSNAIELNEDNGLSPNEDNPEPFCPPDRNLLEEIWWEGCGY